MNSRTLILAFALTGVFSASAQAQYLNFDFSFTNGTDTVSGEIYGLLPDASSTPSDIRVTAAPVSTGVTLPDDFNQLIAGGFTVSGTDIVGTYSTPNPANGGPIADDSSSHQIFFNFESENSLSPVTNLEAFAGVTYNYVDTTSYAFVPEPSGYGSMIFLAFVGLFAWSKFSRRSRMA